MRPRSPYLLIAAFLPALSCAQVYSWKDANGKVHYGDRPPAAQQTEARKLAAPPPVDAEAERKALNERLMADREKQQKAQEEGKKKQESQTEAKKRAEGCQRARSSLAAIESGQIRYALNAKGERTALDGAARETEIARARRAVSEWCAPPPKPAGQ
jgi:membrane protein involved in colicin uptake